MSIVQEPAPEHPILRNLPNALTVLRLLCVPALVAAMVHAEGASVLAGLIFFFAAATDFLDGYLARRLRITSHFGKVADPLADRLLVNAAVMLLCIYDARWTGNPDARLLGPEFVVVVARDLVASYGYSRIRSAVIPDVTMLGKWGMAFMMAGLTWLLLLPQATWPVWPFWIGLVTSVVVLAQYVQRYSWAARTSAAPGARVGSPGGGGSAAPASADAESAQEKEHEMDALPDLGSLDDEALKALIDRYVQEEREVSYRRRILHGYIDILRGELIARKKAAYSGEGGALDGVDVDRLTSILAGKGLPESDDDDQQG